MEINKRMFLVANALRNALIEQIERNGTTFKGHLKNSIKVTFEGNKLVITGLEYGLYVEYGRPPGKPVSPEHLKEWCRLKLGDENAAFAVAKKISEEGIEPRPWLRPVIHTQLKEIMQRYL